MAPCKTADTSTAPINTRAEMVAAKPTVHRTCRDRRCLVLADGFYEWQRQERGKQPFYIRLHDGRPFAFAGLRERWAPQEGQPIESWTILTTVANDLIQPLHVRMPVVLAPGDCDLWVDPSVHEAERLQPLLHPYPSEKPIAYPVRTRVNSPANDSLDCIEPLA